MSLINKGSAQRLKKQTLSEDNPRQRELAGALFNQFNEWHSRSVWDDIELERLIIKQKEHELKQQGWFSSSLVMFSPSSASKCKRELYFKALKLRKDKGGFLPYQKRWVRNSTAVHEVTQKDLLYMWKFMPEAPFKIKFKDGLPMWERNNAQLVELEHNGVMFALAGMMDGQLEYKDGSTVGFEFKTKSNSVAQVGTYKMKSPADSHAMQCTAYSLLFGMNEFIVMYEAVAKDNWNKGTEARSDIRTFCLQVSEAQQLELLDKFAEVAVAVENEDMPDMETDKCLFCEYKTICGVA